MLVINACDRFGDLECVFLEAALDALYVINACDRFGDKNGKVCMVYRTSVYMAKASA
jgi:hypothetical protein